MAVVGGLLILIGVAGVGVAIAALVKGGLVWANITNRKVAAGVLAGAFAVVGVGGALSPQADDPPLVQTTGWEFLASPDETIPLPPPSTTTTTAPTATTAPRPPCRQGVGRRPTGHPHGPCGTGDHDGPEANHDDE